MSAVVRAHRPRKLPLSAPMLWLVLGLAAAFFLVRYGQEVLMEHDLNAKIAAQRAINAQMDEENKRLEAALQYYLSDKYVEQRAREDLNLRRADEEVLIPVGGAGTEGSGTKPGVGAAEEDPGATAPRPNWQRWLDLFSPFGGRTAPAGSP